MAKKTTTTGYSIPNALADKISERAESAGMSKSEALSADVDAYLGILDYGLGKARAVLSADDARVILSAITNPSIYTGQDAVRWMTTNLLYSVQDAFDMDGAAENYQVDGPALVAKISAMPEFSRLALVYWCRMMWAQSENEALWSAEMGRYKG